MNTRRLYWGRLSWLLVALICLVYAPMASEYMLHFVLDGSPRLWDHFYAAVTSERMAMGAGSAFAEQHQVYRQSLLPMFIHGVIGGLIILLFTAQFSTTLRRRHPALHRGAGRLAGILVVISMLSAMVYLLRTGPFDTFSGPAFYAQLWGLAVGTLLSTLIGIALIRRKQVALHQCVMAYAFALLMATPLLRVLWLLFGLLWPDLTQKDINIVSATLLATIVPTGGIIASRYYDRRQQLPAQHRPLPGLPMTLAVCALSAVAAVWIAARYAAGIGVIDRQLVTAVAAIFGLLPVFVGMALLSHRRGNRPAAEEWRLHSLGLLGSLPLALLMWSLYGVFFSATDAFYATALTAPALALSTSFLIALRRRATATPAGRQSAPARPSHPQASPEM